MALDYQELILSVETPRLEEAGSIAAVVSPLGFYVEDYSDLEEQVEKITHMNLIEPELLEKDKTHGKLHLYLPMEQNPGEVLSFLETRFAAADIPYALETATVAEQDWATAWKQYYKPVRVGERLVVVPSWETATLCEGDVALTLDPGMAFGTGTHETTRLCMRLLEQSVTDRCRVLDLGTGSGILAICAVLLGAHSALGVDIDPVAVRVAKENAALNRVTDRTDFQSGDLTATVTGKYDLVCANIVADVILRLLPVVSGFMERDAKLLLSGIITPRVGEIVDALEEQGFAPVKMLEENGWSALEVQRL